MCFQDTFVWPHRIHLQLCGQLPMPPGTRAVALGRSTTPGFTWSQRGVPQSDPTGASRAEKNHAKLVKLSGSSCSPFCKGTLPIHSQLRLLPKGYEPKSFDISSLVCLSVCLLVCLFVCLCVCVFLCFFVGLLFLLCFFWTVSRGVVPSDPGAPELFGRSKGTAQGQWGWRHGADPDSGWVVGW